MKFIYPIFSKHDVFDDNQTVREYISLSDNDTFFEIHKKFPYELLEMFDVVVINNVKQLLHYEPNLISYYHKVIDSNIILYCDNRKQLSHTLHSDIPVLQLSHHIQKANMILNALLESFDITNETIYRNMMMVLLNYYHIESNKVYVSTDTTSGFLHTWFNMYNKTFRPTNRYNSINFTALSKKDGSREKIQSRFIDDGILLSLDFTAHNIYLIAQLIDFDFGGENPYIYLGQYYEQDLSYSDIKITTFFNIFNQTVSDFMHIDFFKKLNDFIDNLYDKFKTDGHIVSPIFNRTMNYGCYTINDIEMLPKHTLFNYYCQTYETEYNNTIMNKIIYRLSDKQDIKFIMYIYDELIFDLKYYEIPKLMTIFEEVITELPYKINAGYNFSDMERIDDLSIDYFTKKTN